MKLTIKDFILLHKKCKNCGGKFKIIMHADLGSYPFRQIFPTIKNGKIISTIDIKYNYSANFIIDPKTNKYSFSPPSSESNFVDFFLEARCLSCEASCCTDYIILYNGIIKPTFIFNEDYNVNIDDKVVNITNYYDKEVCQIMVQHKDDLSPVFLTLPLAPIYQMKDKKELLEKINLILVFN